MTTADAERRALRAELEKLEAEYERVLQWGADGSEYRRRLALERAEMIANQRKIVLAEYLRLSPN
jgi:molecular chaperone GrpE (heat shock protein)